ncbi:hypothetical protein EJP617_33310 [Erwinia sp. Ejp617]|nr:hypothetical protein EJP617_33310 [Erwinia sp. Ejp617]
MLTARYVKKFAMLIKSMFIFFDVRVELRMFEPGLLKLGFTLRTHGSERFPIHSRFPLIDFPRVVVHFVIFGKIDVVMIADWHINTFIQ